MYGYDESADFERPKIFSGQTFLLSVFLHVAFFAVLWIFAVLHGFLTPKETIIPIDLSIVVNENLNGKENEPPPLKNPEPTPPKAQPKPKPKPKPAEVTPPKPLEQMEIDKPRVTTKPKPKPEPKPKPKPEPKPTPTKKPSLEERIQNMRKSVEPNTKPVKIQVDKAKESGNGRTERQTMNRAEIEKFLGAGYKPGTKTQLAESDLQLGVSLVKMALEEKWERVQPKVGRSGTVLLSCKLNSSGGLIQVRISKTCGDALSDQAALMVAKQVLSIPTLPEKFISRFMRETLTINYKVQGR